MPEKYLTRFIGGLPIISVTRFEFAEMMVRDWRLAKAAEKPFSPKVSFSANGELLSLNASSSEFAEVLEQADTIDADGQSLVLFSKFWPGPPLPDRIATTDFFHDAAAVAESHGISFYLLGATEEVITNTVVKVREMYPRLKIAGWRNGYFDLSEEKEIIEQIRATNPDIIWIGMGSPRQQNFCIRVRDQLAGVTWIKTCGGLFDFISGQHRRAPLWMQKIGFEWLFRLALEPRRLFWRYAFTNFHALYLMLIRSNQKC